MTNTYTREELIQILAYLRSRIANESNVDEIQSLHTLETVIARELLNYDKHNVSEPQSDVQ